MPLLRPARVRLLAAAAAVLTAVSLVGAAGADPAGAAPAATPAATVVRYAVNKPLCNEPADAAAMRCFGLKRVDVPRGTAGAYKYRTLATGSTSAAVGAGPSGGYTPQQFATAYGYNSKLKRSSLTIGIVLWHDAPNVLRDLNHFNAKYHLPKETKRSFRKVNERGKASPLPKRDRSSASEIALDTQAVRGVCNTCRILLVEADGPYDTDLANGVNTAVRLGADIVTNSYGTPERRFSKKVQAAYRHPGVGIVASSGDSGWFGWDYANDPRYLSDGAASFPSTSPNVIAVGGTTLRLNARNQRASETVWNNNGAHDAVGNARSRPMGASGGGCSKYFTAPAWQRRAPGYAAAKCNGRRLATDVALDANPSTGFDVYDTYGSGGWVTIGGTSLSAPLAAGMLALAGGPKGARYPASALYANAASRSWTRYDVTVGGNGFCSTDTTTACANAVYTGTALRTHNPNRLGLGLVDCSFSRLGSEAVSSTRRSECTATTGFDGPSGVGTPRTPSLFNRSDPYLGVRYSGSLRHGKVKTFRAKVSTPLAHTTITSLTWKWGDGRKATTTTKTRSAKHTYRKAGRYTVTLSSYDSRGQISVTTKKITVH